MAIFLDAMKRGIVKHDVAIPIYLVFVQLEEKDMTRINRERTSNKRLLSKTIGELIEMQQLTKRRV